MKKRGSDPTNSPLLATCLIVQFALLQKGNFAGFKCRVPIAAPNRRNVSPVETITKDGTRFVATTHRPSIMQTALRGFSSRTSRAFDERREVTVSARACFLNSHFFLSPRSPSYVVHYCAPEVNFRSSRNK